MEKLELKVERRSGALLDNPWSAIFGLAGGTIGRGGQNKLILPDPESAVARVHAMVRIGSSDAYIANLCERRTIEIDGNVIGPGEEVMLPLNATISIGPYQVKVCDANAKMGSEGQPIARQAVEPNSEATTNSPTEIFLDNAQSNQALLLMDSVGPARDAAKDASSMQKLDAPIDTAEHRKPDAQTANVFAAITPTKRNAASPQPDRALFIPDDFNPFEAPRHHDAADEWGGLKTHSLTEIAQQSHDGLIKSLPMSGSMQDTLDNPAHSGLPKRLDPNQDLDPLSMFDSSSFIATPDVGVSSVGRSSELAHVFHLPKTKLPEHPIHRSTREPQNNTPSLQHASAESLQAVQNVGLQTMQGLDLALFGDAASQSLAAPSLLLSPLQETAHSRKLPVLGSAETASDSHHDQAPAAELQAFGLTLSGDIPPISATQTPSMRQTPSPPIASFERKPVASKMPPAANSTSLLERNNDALAAAFLEGAGLASDRVHLELSPEFMRSFGEAFRLAIEGSIDLLAARSEIKQEFRAGVTIIASSANNPLKFLPNADGVIMQMVGQQFPGFMKPVPAIKEAFDDLRVHQLALMAGIRAAYSEALLKFDPQKMESQTPRNGLLSNLYDGVWKADMWDQYKKNFSHLKNSAEDDLTAFSGQTFVQAYEQAANTAKGEP